MQDLLEREIVKDNVVFKNHYVVENDHKEEILNGLLQNQKTLNPKFFYDTYGSELFEKITELPEYYLTRTERSILNKYAQDMAEHCGDNCILIEPGSGSSEKVRLLLDAIKPKAYVPMDIAGEFLQRSANKLGEEFPWLDIHAVCADFSQYKEVPEGLPKGKPVIFYPGSTLGNMTPEQASRFLSTLRQWLISDATNIGGALIGVDLHKPSSILHAAYNDEEGVTARFNLNALNNVNKLLSANFNTKNFEHQAFYNEDHKRIEMHLVSKVDHIVNFADTALAFSEGETIHTENSYKYTLDGFEKLVNQSGFEIISSWLDDECLFGVHYLSVVCD